jgi:predicted  nucleic acid-binding Zn-ribbon protein
METQNEPTREAHTEKLKVQINDWSARLDTLKAKAGKAEAQAKVELHKAVEELSHLQDSAKQELAKLTSASAEAWKDVKHGVEGAWTKVSSAIDSAWKKVQS